MRGYRDQFEPEAADLIDKLSTKLESLQYPTGPSRYYALDLAMCLRSGALAGSMIIASALIEVYVRGLVVRYSEEAQKKWSRKVEAEQELESMRKLSFGKLLDHLVGVGLFLAKDSQQAKTIYRDIRIPTHHGLPSRLLGRDKGDSLFSIMTLCGLSSSVSMSDFESFVEEEALTVVNNIVSIIERNQFGVDRYG